MHARSSALTDTGARRLSGDARAVDSAAADETEALYVGYVQTYYSGIVRYVFGMVPSMAVAEDLTQDTFLKAYLALGRSGPPENPKAWLYRIATNTSLDHLRKRRRVGFVALDKLSNILRGRDMHAAVETADPLERALCALRDDERCILLLFAETGLKAPEVAEVLGITPAAARKRRQRARVAFTAAYRDASP